MRPPFILFIFFFFSLLSIQFCSSFLFLFLFCFIFVFIYFPSDCPIDLDWRAPTESEDQGVSDARSSKQMVPESLMPALILVCNIYIYHSYYINI